MVKSFLRKAQASFYESSFGKSKDDNKQNFHSYQDDTTKNEDRTGSQDLTIEVEQLKAFFVGIGLSLSSNLKSRGCHSKMP